MRQWLIDKRKALGLSRKAMGRECKCSERLLEILELDDGITHPGIAAWVAFRYGLTVEQFNMLVSEGRQVQELPPPKEPPTLQEYYADKYATEARYKNN